MEKRVTGIGGVFFKAKDPAKLREWYRRHLGVNVLDWGGTVFDWADESGQPIKGATVWAVKSSDDDSFEPSQAPFMLNYRVNDAKGLAQTLRQEGCDVADKIEESDFGVFAWVMDPEGNKIELWQPPADR